LIAHGAAMVLVNEPETMGSTHGRYFLVTDDQKFPLNGSKDEIAASIWDYVIHHEHQTGKRQE